MGNELFFEEKKYISASRASKLIGYNSDYIGQLCRKGSLTCRRIGRVWFVEEESLKNHKVIASNAPRGRIAIYTKRKVEREKNSSQVPFESKQTIQTILSKQNSELIIPAESTKIKISEIDDVSKGTRVSHEEKIATIAPAVNAFVPKFLQKQKVIDGDDFLNNRLREVSGLNLVRKIESKKLSWFGIKKIGVGILVISFVLSGGIFIFPSPISEHVKIFVTRVGDNVSHFVQNNQERKFSGLSDTNNVIAIGNNANALQSIGSSVENIFLNIANGSFRLIASIGNFFHDATRRARLIVFNSSPVNVSDSKKIDINSDTRAGFVVLPSTGDTTQNDQVKEYVINTFSDEAKIIPDESGNSGLIKPVFKDKDDQEYLYVVVPLNENGD